MGAPEKGRESATHGRGARDVRLLVSMTDVSAATSSDQRPVLADAHGEPSAAMESTSAPVIPEEYHENATVAMREVLDGLREYVETWSQKTRETTERLGEEVSNRRNSESVGGTIQSS